MELREILLFCNLKFKGFTFRFVAIGEKLESFNNLYVVFLQICASWNVFETQRLKGIHFTKKLTIIQSKV